MAARVQRCLNNYWKDNDIEARADVLESFIRALADVPLWIVASAFDRWEQQHNRRPTPADIRNKCSRIREPITAEIDRRDRQRIADGQAQVDAAREIVTPERRAAILAEVGFRLSPQQPPEREPMQARRPDGDELKALHEKARKLAEEKP
ncbi:MAG: hypothetical protein AAFM92_03125 [Pseudomonadota bacterium]